LFDTEDFSGEVTYDIELGKAPLYGGLKVDITQNRNKLNRVVNGQPATVVYRESASVILLLPRGYICCVYPGIIVDQYGNRRTV